MLGSFVDPLGIIFRRLFGSVFACFFGVRFWWFWASAGVQKGSPKRPRGSKRGPQGGPNSVQNQLKIELGAGTPFWCILGPIWGRFWDHFGLILGRFRRSKRNSNRKQRETHRKAANESRSSTRIAKQPTNPNRIVTQQTNRHNIAFKSRSAPRSTFNRSGVRFWNDLGLISGRCWVILRIDFCLVTLRGN